ncbi:RsmB/NOP family class I SAM-dependent RNA methyltransferase [Luteibaculum oceani]|uniref:RsmB/NOP family class I SAM-dependent RNA methyltransferase n=1 Tax=Luteibaculum oceani TaxID=1294296 RepID=A0A5C6UZW5_9FLAO|nr:RsmB/NOP family class I SAM-dependent RNA methyltransferase [Luteibaculum oceani]TXC78459.1 RsmB/NOP family class I SAM-dependent RNA methyltransferase [Luteibaculum oceani]
MKPTKFLPYQRNAFSELIGQWKENNHRAERILNKYFRDHKKLGSRDRRLLSVLFYSYVKNFYFIDSIEWESEEEQFEFLIVLDNTPVSEKLEILKQKSSDIEQHKLVSCPEWILNKWEEQDADPIKTAIYQLGKSDVFLRLNGIKVSQGEINKLLEDEELEISFDAVLNCYKSTSKKLSQSAAYKNGLIEIQDYGSQRIGEFVEAKPNDLIIDACCGAGGKTLLLADKMKNTGKIWALDPRMKALEEASDRADRAGVENVEFFEIPENPEEVNFPFQCQKLLLDVPCTGSGTFSRNPDQKYKLTEVELLRLVDLQAKILRQYSKWVFPGGKLVYATCSTFQEENRKQIDRFISESDNWVLEEDQMIWPGPNHDGFYMARLIRKD